MRDSTKHPKVDRVCERCQKSFQIWYSLLRHGKAGRWCSRECFLADSRVDVFCDYCGITFTRQRKTANRYKGKNYCSRECNNFGRRNPNRIASKRMRYGATEFQKARKLVIERDGVCQICESALANSVHHKDWNSIHNHLDNLVLLCKRCHGCFKRYEDWNSGRKRIMACSELTGDRKSAIEILAPSIFASNKTETGIQVRLQIHHHQPVVDSSGS